MISSIKNQARLSFRLGSVPFAERSPKVNKYENGNETVTVYEFDGGLKVTNKLTVYPEYDACEWVNEWENTGSEATELITELFDACVELPFGKSVPKTTGRAYLPASENVVKVYAPKGSDWSEGEFFCDVDLLEHNRYKNWLSVGQTNKYATSGGRSANTANAPFFNIKHGAEDFGIIAAVGWTGQWNAEIERREESIVFKSKIEDTSFVILPGESFRTSSVTLVSYSGTVQDGQNKWRRLVKDKYSPVGKREVPALAPFCAGLWGGMSSAGCVERIERVEKEGFPFDHYWMDAGWYGFGKDRSPDEYEGDWSQHTGNWVINEARHPDGMLDVVNAIGKGTKRFILWFEPERIRADVPITKEHPEYLISLGAANPNLLLNLGREDAWQYCFDTVSGLIEKLKVSVYRQDFNFCPLEYWRINDTDQRRGITEIKHINGLYKLWDALLDKFPYLLIDNCASGGRRIDVETLKRSIPLWRSDAQCPADPVPELTQAHSLSHGSWMPYSGTGVGRIWFDTYRFRSAYAPALSTNFTFSENNTFGDNEEGMAWLHKMCREFVRVRPYLSEDIYPLTTPSADKSLWSAVMYRDGATDSGVVQVFRRENSPFNEATFPFFGADKNKTYLFEDADGGEFTVTGEELSSVGLTVRVMERRAAKVFFFKPL